MKHPDNIADLLQVTDKLYHKGIECTSPITLIYRNQDMFIFVLKHIHVHGYNILRLSVFFFFSFFNFFLYYIEIINMWLIVK